MGLTEETGTTTAPGPGEPTSQPEIRPVTVERVRAEFMKLSSEALSEGERPIEQLKIRLEKCLGQAGFHDTKEYHALNKDRIAELLRYQQAFIVSLDQSHAPSFEQALVDDPKRRRDMLVLLDNYLRQYLERDEQGVRFPGYLIPDNDQNATLRIIGAALEKYDEYIALVIENGPKNP